MADKPEPTWSFSLPEEPKVPEEGFSFNMPETAPAEAKPVHEGILTNRPEDSSIKSAAKFLGTMALRGAANIPGVVGDLSELADWARTGVKSYIQDRPHAQIMQEEAEARKKSGNWYFPTSEEIYQKVAAPYLGEYKPESTLGKTLMGAGTTAIGMLGPGGVIGQSLKAARAAPTAAAANAARNAVLSRGLGAGALGGGASTFVTEEYGSPGAGIAAGLVAPLALGIGGLRSDPTRAVRKELTSYMSEPKETTAKILSHEQRPGDFTQTTALMSGDEGLARAQHDLASSNKSTAEFATQLGEVNRQRNAEIIGALDQAAPHVNPLLAADAMKAEQSNLLNQLEQAERISSLHAADPVTAAKAARENIDSVWRNYAQETERLYNRMDSQGAAVTPLQRLKRMATMIETSHKPDVHLPMSDGLKTILDMIKKNEDQISFKDAVSLDKSIEATRRSLARNPETAWDAKRLGNLKEAMGLDLDNTTGLTGNMTGKEALAIPKQHYRMGKEIFDNKYVGPALRYDAKNYRYMMSDASAAKEMFQSGPVGGHAAEAWLRAAGPQRDAILDQMENVAISTLGTKPLTEKALQDWRLKYKPALDVLERERPGFLAPFTDTAMARRAVDDLQGGIAQGLLGATDSSQVIEGVGRMLRNRSAGPNQWGEMLSSIRDPHAREQAQQALQRAGVEFIKNGMFDEKLGTISAARMRSFLEDNEANLRGLYGANYSNMERVANELAKGQEVTRVGQVTTGSSTGYNQRAQVQRNPVQQPSILAAAMASTIGGYTLPGLGWATGPAAYMAQKWMAKSAQQRQVVLDQMIADALLHPEVAKAVLSKPTAESLRILYPYFGMAAAGAAGEALDSEAGENARKYNPYIVGRGESAVNEIIPRVIRNLNPFARGGAAKGIDHGAEADGLIRMAEKAKKQHNKQTEPLLNQPDEVVVKALKIANEATQ